ncbi:Trihelix transcription factor [Actinidia chinensis var. chinensis]|uniref:Trihelix transcription factor n=1 Tax=Actinidia chinensis var. chinensis TaxID=1590841 RepID=A0A2R6R9T7_ACTCC|nr:Trihelix transcription factor [Actinidia chinensis var. chinensis]
MDPNKPNPSPLTHTPKEDSPPKPPPLTTGGSGGDRLKRDEWSEGAVSTLLEAYEAKWVLRNRAKLKGQDWEDVAKHVSLRAHGTKSPKTQTQCKNKIESMKKRYRSESAAAEASSWPLFPRLDLLLRGSAPPQPPVTNSPLVLIEPFLPPPLPPPLPHGIAQNSHGSNGVDRVAKEDGVGTKLSEHESDKNPPVDTDSSTPALYSDKEKMKSKSLKTRADKKKKRREDEWEVGESIRWLAEVVVRSEQARMDTMREVEKMRAEAEAKRGEIDLKRTEILANTQLEIARLFAGVGKGIDSSLRIGRS